MSNAELSGNELSLIGERFVYKNFPLLFRKHLVKCEWNTVIPERPKAEGADIEGWLCDWSNAEDNWLGDEWEEVILDRVGNAGSAFLLEKVTKGPIEVKTCAFNQYIARMDQGFNFDCGVISFAIWNSFTGEPPRTRLGSLYRMFYPQDANHERYPLSYTAVFLNMKNKPFACLVFEDFPKLQERLVKIGKTCGLDLTKEGFESIPGWQNLNGWPSPDVWAAQKMAENPELHLKGNMWYIRMSAVIDLANVVLIGEPPEIKDGYNFCSREMQEMRWDFLKQHCQRTIPLITEESTTNYIRKRETIFQGMAPLIRKKNEETKQETETENTSPEDSP